MRVIIMMMGMMGVGCGAVMAGTTTVVEPLPIKLSIQSSSVGIGVPLVTEKRMTGGYRSPIEMRFRVLLMKETGLSVPVKPEGIVGEIRVRW